VRGGCGCRTAGWGRRTPGRECRLPLAGIAALAVFPVLLSTAGGTRARARDLAPGLPDLQPSSEVAASTEAAQASAYFPNWPAPGRRLPLRSLTILCENVFAPGDPGAERFYARLANALHVKTREKVIRRMLLFDEGDSVGAVDLEVAMRRLRAQPFLSGDVAMELEGDAQALDVTVRTRDSWSTQPTMQLSWSGGLLEWSFGLREANSLGLGKEVLIEAGREEREFFYGLGYRDPQLFGSQVLAAMEVGFGVDLDFQKFVLERSFESPAAPWGSTVDANRYDGPIVDHRGGLDGPEWGSEIWLVSGCLGRRILGSARHALRLRPFVHWTHERYEPPAEDAGSSASAREDASAEEPGLRDRDIRAAGVRVEVLGERYGQYRQIDALGRWEDIDLGTSLDLGAGYSPRAWGAPRDGLYLTLRGHQGVRLGRDRFLLADAEGSGQLMGGDLVDGLLAIRARYFDRCTARHTLAAGLRGSFAADLGPQNLPTLGVENGLRGFEAYNSWGDHALIGNLEDRVLLIDDLFGLVSIGIAGFLDGGTVWRCGRSRTAHGVASAGLGLRLHSSRASGLLVTRLDVAHPLKGGEEDEGWVVSFATGQAF
jgi:hypothetical protein